MTCVPYPPFHPPLKTSDATPDWPAITGDPSSAPMSRALWYQEKLLLMVPLTGHVNPPEKMVAGPDAIYCLLTIFGASSGLTPSGTIKIWPSTRENVWGFAKSLKGKSAMAWAWAPYFLAIE